MKPEKCEPQAFPGILLRSHLAAVGAAVNKLFSLRLSRLSRLARELKEYVSNKINLLKIAELAASLHDIGKAAPYYQVDLEAARFPGHELVSAAILVQSYELLVEAGKDKLATLMLLAGWAVSRHHAAMPERHPTALTSLKYSSGILQAAARALQSLAAEPGCIDASLPLPVRHRIGNILVDATMRLTKLARATKPTILLVETIRSLNTIPSIVSPLKRKWHVYVSIITGAIIVADVLVAKIERRDTDDKMVGYAAWWLRELSIQEDEIRQLVGSIDASEQLLDSELTSIDELND